MTLTPVVAIFSLSRSHQTTFVLISPCAKTTQTLPFSFFPCVATEMLPNIITPLFLSSFHKGWSPLQFPPSLLPHTLRPTMAEAPIVPPSLFFPFFVPHRPKPLRVPPPSRFLHMRVFFPCVMASNLHSFLCPTSTTPRHPSLPLIDNHKGVSPPLADHDNKPRTPLTCLNTITSSQFSSSFTT